MDYEQLKEMFPSMTEKEILEEIEINNYNLEQTLNSILMKQENQNKIEQPKINQVPQPQKGCSGGQDKCGCACHDKQGVVFHVFPCCYVCPSCKLNIPTNLKEQHEKGILKKQPFKEEMINDLQIEDKNYDSVCIKGKIFFFECLFFIFSIYKFSQFRI